MHSVLSLMIFNPLPRAYLHLSKLSSTCTLPSLHTTTTTTTTMSSAKNMVHGDSCLGGGGISSSILSVFFTDKFALSQSDARISVAYKFSQWKALTKCLMKHPPDLICQPIYIHHTCKQSRSLMQSYTNLETLHRTYLAPLLAVSRYPSTCPLPLLHTSLPLQIPSYNAIGPMSSLGTLLYDFAKSTNTQLSSFYPYLYFSYAQ